MPLLLLKVFCLVPLFLQSIEVFWPLLFPFPSTCPHPFPQTRIRHNRINMQIRILYLTLIHVV